MRVWVLALLWFACGGAPSAPDAGKVDAGSSDGGNTDAGIITPELKPVAPLGELTVYSFTHTWEFPPAPPAFPQARQCRPTPARA